MNDTREESFFDTIQPDSSDSGFLSGNKITIALGVGLLICAILAAYYGYSYSSISGKMGEKDDEINKLGLEIDEYAIQVDSLADMVDVLEIRADSLFDEKIRLETSLDSLESLLYMARSSANSSQQKIAQLQRELEQTKAQLADVQRKYDEVVALNNATLEEYRNQIDQLNLQISSLEEENRQLRQDVGKYEGNADNRKALFTTLVIATPGQIKRSRFSPTFKRRRVEQIEVQYRLSRSPQTGEDITIKLFDPSNNEVDAKVNEKNEASTDEVKKVRVLEAVGDYDYSEGSYTVRIFASNPDTGDTTEIGSARFELK